MKKEIGRADVSLAASPGVAGRHSRRREPGGGALAGEAGTLRVLVVEDNHVVALSLCELLQSWGYEVEMAHDGAAALELARAFRPDVVLLDIGLPVLDGYEVARQMRARDGQATTVFIALTGYGESDERRREGLFDLYLVKPVEPRDLRGLLEDFVEQRRPR